jgi:hypothetical protein
VIGHNFRDLLHNCRVVDVKTPELGKRLGSFVWSTPHDEPARVLGQENAANDQNESPHKLYSNRYPIGAGIVTILSRVVDNGSEEKTNDDSELIRTDDDNTNPLGGSLGMVQRNRGTDHYTPYPAKKCSATNSGMEVAMVCKTTPTQKTTLQVTRPRRQPR